MISLSKSLLDELTAWAEAAYPEEACGLLVGTREENDQVRLTRLVKSRNVSTGDRTKTFEVDPQVRFDLMRGLRAGDGFDHNERLVGVFHSHPDHPAEPSKMDLAMAFEPDLVWLITALDDGKVTDTRAFRIAGDRLSFHSVDLVVEET